MTAQDSINDYWTGRAPGYAEHQLRPERLADDTAAWSEVWSSALPATPLDVLDVGSGRVASVLAGLGHRVTGIDLSEGMLEQARATVKDVDFRLGDAVAPDLPAGSFDAVTAAVLEEAGLTGVTVTPLTAIYDLDQKYGVAPGHDVQTQYLITGGI
uniref:class I SAM-dependent methyltransferase n=1 Tax=Paractinoplanes polyasparticus TaxID=2856853 RepID=UPI001C85D549|nr:class I SAM-dependent methyltransferase [Actinoplanes polyasparticus]